VGDGWDCVCVMDGGVCVLNLGVRFN
jgi:hypothetical protein